jgi:hypothetical protein
MNRKAASPEQLDPRAEIVSQPDIGLGLIELLFGHVGALWFLPREADFRFVLCKQCWGTQENPASVEKRIWIYGETVDV